MFDKFPNELTGEDPVEAMIQAGLINNYPQILIDAVACVIEVKSDEPTFGLLRE